MHSMLLFTFWDTIKNKFFFFIAHYFKIHVVVFRGYQNRGKIRIFLGYDIKKLITLTLSVRF
jgi:hypothetical protein